MHRSRLALTVLAALVLALATGCGSDDDSKSDASGESGAKSEQSAKPSDDDKAAAPKKASARSKLVTCIEDAGYEISHEGDDAEKATDYTVGPEDPKRTKAQITIHSNRGDAQRSADKKGLEKGINAVAFGRAEFIRRQATDTEAGRIVNCMSMAYGG